MNSAELREAISGDGEYEVGTILERWVEELCLLVYFWNVCCFVVSGELTKFVYLACLCLIYF